MAKLDPEMEVVGKSAYKLGLQFGIEWNQKVIEELTEINLKLQDYIDNVNIKKPADANRLINVLTTKVRVLADILKERDTSFTTDGIYLPYTLFDLVIKNLKKVHHCRLIPRLLRYKQRSGRGLRKALNQVAEEQQSSNGPATGEER